MFESKIIFLNTLRKKKLVYIISKVDKSLAFEWLATSDLQKRFELNFILLNPGTSYLEAFLKQQNIPVTLVKYSGKKSMARAFSQVFFKLITIRADIVHAHFLDAQMIGISAAFLAKVPRRIYTRHHSSFHHVYYPKGVFYDRLVNAMSTNIVAISKVVKKILVEKEQVAEDKIALIHHGFKLEMFEHIDKSRVEEVRERNKVPVDSYPILGVIARFEEWKGIQYIIPAFKKLLENYPDAHLILANANGIYEGEVNEMLKTLPKESITKIRFEYDIPALYKLFDVYIHTPVNNHSEAFGQTYIEALASQIPSIFTASGIATEFIENEVNALMVDYGNPDQVFDAIGRLLKNDQLRESLKRNGYASVKKRFQLEKMTDSLTQLYLSSN